MDTIFESKSTHLSHDAKHGCMRLQIKGFIKEEEFREVLTQAMNTFARLGVKKVLNDFRAFKGTTPAMQQWVVKNYYPAMVKKGLTHGALVLNSDVFAKYTTKNVRDKAAQGFDYQAFPCMTDAEEWLKKQ